VNKVTDRPYERCTVCGNLLGQLSDAVDSCKKCGTDYSQMPDKKERDIFVE